MGWARGDGYRVDSPAPVPGPAPKTTNATPIAPTHRPVASTGAQRAGRARDRRHRNRRPKDSGCKNPQVRKGLGSCVFVLGIPTLIAGLILTIVSSTDDGDTGHKYPTSFPVAGPVLLAMAVLCFVTGVLLYNIALCKHLQECLQLSDKPDSFCRRHFPRLTAWLKPDTVSVLNQNAIKNLQTAPSRSALRKVPNPALVTMETELHEGGEGHPHGDHNSSSSSNSNSNNSNPAQNHQQHQAPRRKRAVTFFRDGADDDLDGGFVGVRLDSSSSDPDPSCTQTENGGGSLNGHSPSSSLLSLRHCKIHPKEDVFWTESSADGGGVGVAVAVRADDGAGVSEGGGHPTVAGGGDGSGAGSDGGGGGGGVRAERFPLTDICEERA